MTPYHFRLVEILVNLLNEGLYQPRGQVDTIVRICFYRAQSFGIKNGAVSPLVHK